MSANNQGKTKTPSPQEIQQMMNVFSIKLENAKLDLQEATTYYNSILQGLMLIIKEKDEKITELQVPVIEKTPEKAPEKVSDEKKSKKP